MKAVFRHVLNIQMSIETRISARGQYSSRRCGMSADDWIGRISPDVDLAKQDLLRRMDV